MKLTFVSNSQSFTIELTPDRSGKTYRAAIGDTIVDVEILRAEEGRLDLLINKQHATANVSSDNARRWVTINGRTFVLTKVAAGAKRSAVRHDHASELAAPMPGQVRSVNVAEGDVVGKGQTLLVIEAMKMEIRIHAPRDGKVVKLFVKQGQTVEREQTLVEIEES